MKMVPVESGMIKAIGFEDGKLHIVFKSGAVYEHEGVSAAEHSALMSAESHGKRYNSHIKGKYAGRPVPNEEQTPQSSATPREPAEEPRDLDTAIRRFRGEQE